MMKRLSDMATSARLSAEEITSNKTVKRVGAVIRAAVRSNEFFLIPVALVIGVLSGAAVTAMSAVAQLAHMLIYGIAIDVRLSASDVVNSLVAIIAPAAGGLVLG